MEEKLLEVARNSINIESNSIANILNYLDEKQFCQAVEVLSTCSKIITTGSGSSGIAAKKFAHSLCCIERSAQFLSPAEAIHGGLGCVNEKDAVIIVSRGGKTAELLPIINVCDIKNSTIIGITENLNSPLGNKAQIIIPIKIEQESDKFDVMATASFVTTIALFDAILVALIEKTDYKLEQFALIHPGGAVGEELENL